MGLYKSFIRPILFLQEPEVVHKLTFKFLKLLSKFPFAVPLIKKIFLIQDVRLERELFGLKFPNPVGIAAGFDKNSELINILHSFGFGFIEIGTVTPKPQEGNSKPRLFRLLNDNALINRMGFNNLGVDDAILKLKKRNLNLIIGGNIGKNTTTPNENAIKDYCYCFEKLFNYIDYFVVNVSCPNITNLHQLQDKDALLNLLSEINRLNSIKPKRKPVLLKISPDLNDFQLDDVIQIVKQTGIDGIVATNTTTVRENLSYDQNYINNIGSGGLSGKPIKDRSTRIIKYISEKSNNSIPIIGVGGIMKPEDAIEKLNAGATLIQIYTGFIYEGPGFVKSINKKILQLK